MLFDHPKDRVKQFNSWKAGIGVVSTKSWSDQRFWEPSDLFKGKSDPANAKKYQEFCRKCSAKLADNVNNVEYTL